VPANDWQTGLVPARLAVESTSSPSTVFTIRNMAYQGNFPLTAAQDLGLSPSLLSTDCA
jgi:starch synthase